MLGIDPKVIHNALTRGALSYPPVRFGGCFIWSDKDVERVRQMRDNLRPRGRPPKGQRHRKAVAP
jgi:hypothetical protein